MQVMHSKSILHMHLYAVACHGVLCFSSITILPYLNWLGVGTKFNPALPENIWSEPRRL